MAGQKDKQKVLAQKGNMEGCTHVSADLTTERV